LQLAQFLQIARLVADSGEGDQLIQPKAIIHSGDRDHARGGRDCGVV
jgi:hypothetical protein